ncbi:MAG: hypothetical protein ACXWUI_11800, partial [Burkholderiales bacterium]
CCLPMSMHYLMEWANDRNFWDWFNQSNNSAYVRTRGQLTQWPEAYADNMAEAGLKLKEKNAEFDTNNLPLKFFEDVRDGPFRVAILNNKGQQQGHAIACCLGAEIRLLDVSTGELVFDTAEEARQWLHAHLNVPRINLDLGGTILPKVLSYNTGMMKCTLYKYEISPAAGGPPPPSDLPPPPPSRGRAGGGPPPPSDLPPPRPHGGSH